MKRVRFYNLSPEAKNLLISGLAVCALPTWIWFSRDRPLHTATSAELVTQISARQQSKDDFWRRLPPRHGNLTQADADSAWQNPQTYPARTAIVPNGADEVETVAILELARHHFKGVMFPVFAERGWVENQPTWIVGAAQPVLGSNGPSCALVSAESQLRGAALSSSQISVVAIDFPSQKIVLTQTSDPPPVTWSVSESVE